MHRTAKIYAALITLSLTPTILTAASNGDTGPTSTGTIDLSLSIGTLVNISNLDNLFLGTLNGTETAPPPPVSANDVCLYSSTGAVSIYATSAYGEDTVANTGIMKNATQQEAHITLTMDGKSLFVTPTSTVLTASTQALDCSGNGAGSHDLVAQLTDVPQTAGTYQTTVTINVAAFEE